MTVKGFFASPFRLAHSAGDRMRDIWERPGVRAAAAYISVGLGVTALAFGAGLVAGALTASASVVQIVHSATFIGGIFAVSHNWPKIANKFRL